MLARGRLRRDAHLSEETRARALRFRRALVAALADLRNNYDVDVIAVVLHGVPASDRADFGGHDEATTVTRIVEEFDEIDVVLTQQESAGASAGLPVAWMTNWAGEQVAEVATDSLHHGAALASVTVTASDAQVARPAWKVHRRRGRDVEMPWRRVAATPRAPRG